MCGVWLPIFVFIAVYIVITLEIVNKAVAVLFGVMILLIFRVVDEHTAIGFIDFETIMLLLGMMAIVAILKRTMLFSFVSVKIAELTQGSPLKILILFSVVTAFLSAFLDNVTTVLIVIPIVIQLTAGMGLDSKIYVISQAIISNIGGTATLIGDPPNIIIGSKVGLTFNQFIFNLAVPVLIAMCAAMLFIWITHREKFKPINTNLTKLFSVQLLLEKIRNEYLSIIIEKMFVCKSLACLAIVIGLFVTQTITRISPGVASVFVAMLLFVISKVDVGQMLEEIEWDTLLFFSGLFALVGVLEEKGVSEWLAHNIFMRAGENPYLIVLMVLWVSGLAAGLLNNIPFTITMIPIVNLMQESNPIPNNILWWALVLGACFGGNLTMLGASANIVTVGIAKKYKYNISFLEFMRSSALITLITLVISSIYLSIYLWMSL
ncbi:MAG: ArsB/NhaD family transporter [Planctomycetes bacterium]|nr:ArsB/NhaD family transporter [Planctomycetota bacterium]